MTIMKSAMKPAALAAALFLTTGGAEAARLDLATLGLETDASIAAFADTETTSTFGFGFLAVDTLDANLSAFSPYAASEFALSVIPTGYSGIGETLGEDGSVLDILFNDGAGMRVLATLSFADITVAEAFALADDFDGGSPSVALTLASVRDVAAIPLPATLPLLAAALGLAGWRASRKRASP